MSSKTNTYSTTGTGRCVGACEGNLFKQLADLLHKAASNQCVGFLGHI